MVDRLLCLGGDPSLDSVKSIIEKAIVAWILKSEDQLLNEKGFKTKRSENLLGAYEVELLYCESPCNWSGVEKRIYEQAKGVA